MDLDMFRQVSKAFSESRQARAPVRELLPMNLIFSKWDIGQKPDGHGLFYIEETAESARHIKRMEGVKSETDIVDEGFDGRKYRTLALDEIVDIRFGDDHMGRGFRFTGPGR